MLPPPLPYRHAGKYGQRAGGTHTTGMHSCYLSSSNSRPSNMPHRSLCNLGSTSDTDQFYRIHHPASPSTEHGHTAGDFHKAQVSDAQDGHWSLGNLLD